MGERLLSLGLDVGTTTTQMVISQLLIENRASSFSVPKMEIIQRQVLYQSDVHFTPLLGINRIDADGLQQLLANEFSAAGIERHQINTGAIIITGETSRKENARAVADAISSFSGDFVVATAGPHLESILAAKGADAVTLSETENRPVLHMDIGGGTSNLALIENGRILATGCLNVGGRLLKFDQNGQIIYCSPVLQDMVNFQPGKIPTMQQVDTLCDLMVQALEMAAGLRPESKLLQEFWTKEAGSPWMPPLERPLLSFSGGVAECIDNALSPNAFGDIGPALGNAIRRSKLCQENYHLAKNAIRATVIGAGSYSTQLSGSTVFHQNVTFPIKNLPVVTSIDKLTALDTPGVWALEHSNAFRYSEIIALAEKIVHTWPKQAIYIAATSDIAKALGQAVSLRMPPDASILCIDGVTLPAESYLDVGMPIGSTLPVVVKTLIFNESRRSEL